MSIKEKIVRDLDDLDTVELTKLSGFVEFLKNKSHQKVHYLSDEKLAMLYKEFAEEDKMLAAEGIAEYAASLNKEDKQ